MNWLQIEQVIACLRSYRQHDEDGVMVVVSRQACHEAAEAIVQLNQENSDLRAQCGGMQMEIQELKSLDPTKVTAVNKKDPFMYGQFKGSFFDHSDPSREPTEYDWLKGWGNLWRDAICVERERCSQALCPHGLPIADNTCGPCSEGRPNKVTAQQRGTAK